MKTRIYAPPAVKGLINPPATQIIELVTVIFIHVEMTKVNAKNGLGVFGGVQAI